MAEQILNTTALHKQKPKYIYYNYDGVHKGNYSCTNDENTAALWLLRGERVLRGFEVDKPRHHKEWNWLPIHQQGKGVK